jgi:hypothetical protein
MTRLIALLPIAALVLAAACNNVADKQVVQAERELHAADFARDSTACTDKTSKSSTRAA